MATADAVRRITALLAGGSPATHHDQHHGRVGRRQGAVDRFQSLVAARQFHSDATRYSYASYFDVIRGKLVLDTDAPESVIAPITSLFGSLTEVRVGGVTEDFSRRADVSPFWGGSSIKSNGYVCTSAFDVKNGSGTRYLLTAGHCFSSGWGVTTTDGNVSVGSVVARAPITSRDMELIGGKSYGSSIFAGGTNSSTSKTMVGSGDPAVNYAGYCRSGQTTGEQCGQRVVSVSANFCPSSGCKTNTIAYDTGGASDNGDSGAPFYLPSGSNAYARGMHVGRSTSGTMFAEKWSIIASTMGVSIVT